jgi:hypothetical protein
MLDDFITEEMNTDFAVIPIGSNGDFIKIKPANDKDFQRMRAKRMKRHRQAIKNNTIKDEVLQRELAPLVAKYLLIDWQMTSTSKVVEEMFPQIKTKKAKNPDHVLIPFSEENAAAILAHKRNAGFMNFCLDEAGEVSNFVEQEAEEDRKN